MNKHAAWLMSWDFSGSRMPAVPSSANGRQQAYPALPGTQHCPDDFLPHLHLVLALGGSSVHPKFPTHTHTAPLSATCRADHASFWNEGTRYGLDFVCLRGRSARRLLKGYRAFGFATQGSWHSSPSLLLSGFMVFQSAPTRLGQHKEDLERSKQASTRSAQS